MHWWVDCLVPSLLLTVDEVRVGTAVVRHHEVIPGTVHAVLWITRQRRDRNVTLTYTRNKNFTFVYFYFLPKYLH